MTEQRTMNCITCPMGCEMAIIVEDNHIISVTGNTCPRGEKYAREELTAPKRMFTSTVSITSSQLPLLPVVSQAALPKEKIMDCADILHTVTVQAPIKAGDIVCKNIFELGIDIIASRTMHSID